MKEHTDDVLFSVKESVDTVDSGSSDVIVTKRGKIEEIFDERDKGDDMMVDVVSADDDSVPRVDLGGKGSVDDHAVVEEGSERKKVISDQVKEVSESRVATSDNVKVVVSDEGTKASVEVAKEVIQENLVTTVAVVSDCGVQKSGNGSSKELEAGGGDIEVSKSVVVVADGDHVVEEKTQKESNVIVISSSKIPESMEGHVAAIDEAEDGVDNQSSLNEVVNGRKGEGNVHVSTINTENQAGVDERNKECSQSIIEATTNSAQKSGNGDSKKAVDSTKILESEDSKMDDEDAAEVQGAAIPENAENLDQKAEADQMNNETIEVRTDDVSNTEGSKMDGEPQVTEEEIDVKDKKEDLERCLTKETIEQPTGLVHEVADGDHVMNEKNVKDDVLDSSNISHSSTMVSLGLEDVDVVVVDEVSDGKNEDQDGVSVELSLLTAVVNAGTGDIDQKVEVDSTSKGENSYATCSKDDEVTTAHKDPNSHVQVIIDGGILVENQSMKVEPTTTDQGLIANTSNEGYEITSSHIGEIVTINGTHGVLPANSEFSYEDAHMDREEEAGMDIDEVLGWKDEIPSVHEEDEQKAELTNLSNVQEQETESLEHDRVSLQQSNYFHPPEHEGEFTVSDLVWGKVRSHPWWPGQIFDPSDASENAMKHHKKGWFLVAYFGDQTFGWNDSAVLKPFREYFSQIERQMNSEAFNKAVHCALVEVSRRVELGLTCACIPQHIYENIKCQIVENSGIKQESSRIQGLDESASVNSFEPDKLVDYVRLLATVPYGGTDKMELTMAKAQLSSYGRFKGYGQLAEFQLFGDLLEAEQVIKDETQPEDGSKKRKAHGSISEDLEKRPTLPTEAVGTKPSFNVGAVIQKVASQPTRPPLKGEPADHLAGDNVCVKSLGATQMGNQADMLSQLHLAAQDPMKGYSFVNDVIPYFKGHRAAVLNKFRKRKTSNEDEPDEFEFDDVNNDSYWTDRIIQNHLEEQVLQENPNGGIQHQVVAYEQEKPPVKPARRSNKKRFFSSNHEIEANEQAELIMRRQQNLATEVLMKFANGIYFPSEIHLNKMFRRFGPLMESETEVDRQSGQARVVFKKCSDAEVAHGSAGKINIFGSVSVNYELNYTPLISYKPIPLPSAEDPPHAC